MARKAKGTAKRRRKPLCAKPCNKLRNGETGKALFQACGREEARQRRQLAKVLNW